MRGCSAAALGGAVVRTSFAASSQWRNGCTHHAGVTYLGRMASLANVFILTMLSCGLFVGWQVAVSTVCMLCSPRLLILFTN